MADETLRFDIVGEDNASSAFSRAGESAGQLSRHMDIAARTAKVLDDALRRQESAGKAAADGLHTAERVSAQLAVAERELDKEINKTTRAILGQAAAADEAAKKNKALADSLKKMQSGGPGPLVGAGLALSPAIATIGGVAGGAAIGLGGAAVAGAAALAAFGAVAKPVLSDALKAEQAVQVAQNNYTVAIQAGVNPAKAYAAEQRAINKAYVEMSPQQIALSKQLGTMANAWQDLKAAQTPVVAGALQPWLKSVTDLTGKLGPVIAAVSPVIKGLGAQFDALVNSAAFKGFRDFVAGTGSRVVGAAGGTLIDFIKGAMILLPKFNPLILEATKGIGSLGPAFVAWASSKKTADDITKFMAWFNANGPVVGGLLKNIGAALKTLAPGLTAGGALEIKAISDFLGFIAKLPQGIAAPLAAIAGGLLLLNKLGALSIVVKGVQDLTKAMTGFDIAANANVIGLVVIAVAALGVAFYEAWKKSAGFRDVMKNIASGFLQYGIVIVQIYKVIVNGFLGMVQQILDGAAKAFGWIPGLGGKLRQAASDFSNWRTNVNSSFDAVIRKMQAWQTALNASKNTAATDTQSISASFTGVGVRADTTAGKVNALNTAFTRLPKNVSVSLTETGVGNFTITQGTSGHAGGTPTGGRPGAAAGMYVATGTGPTADDVLIRASRGELVVPAHLVAGGLVDHLRGSIPGFAAGGSIGALAPATTAFNDRFITAVTAAMEKAMTTAMKAAVAVATAAMSAAAGGTAGAGVQQWKGVVLQALKLLGLSPSLLNDVLYQMQTESGGNATIVNRTDSNWLAGHPSVGLMQVIAGTFAQYAGPYRGTGPFSYGVSTNPLANIYAALNYAAHGAGFGSGPGQVGSGHGYDRGGWLQPGLTLAYNGTGRPERVTAGGGDDPLVAELRALRAELRQLTGVAAAIPAKTGQHVAAGVNGAAAAASFRVRYP